MGLFSFGLCVAERGWVYSISAYCVAERGWVCSISMIWELMGKPKEFIEFTMSHSQSLIVQISLLDEFCLDQSDNFIEKQSPRSVMFRFGLNNYDFGTSIYWWIRKPLSMDFMY